MFNKNQDLCSKEKRYFGQNSVPCSPAHLSCSLLSTPQKVLGPFLCSPQTVTGLKSFLFNFPKHSRCISFHSALEPFELIASGSMKTCNFPHLHLWDFLPSPSCFFTLDIYWINVFRLDILANLKVSCWVHSHYNTVFVPQSDIQLPFSPW